MKSIVFAVILSFGALASLSHAGNVRTAETKETVLSVEDDIKLEQRKTSVCFQNLAEDDINVDFVIASSAAFTDVSVHETFELLSGKGSCKASTNSVNVYVHGQSFGNEWDGQACWSKNNVCYDQVYIGSGNRAVRYCFMKEGEKSVALNGKPCDAVIEMK
mmetsp:Transcript_3547/g.4539  ORF Transcript_3547/g.4539 Transcript_3547/m.4539 type:complete len:161 (-) Transcript_3547:264-746(-)|eukprot:CAMPEP_0172491662 /NCGR_PEP_ID=MMETSP1066-20121228/22536_1 /TAXON_ID=671091 /ORGANISM="Coscinodiscus wailesii, Strain CCMP2513" /LENGTH=160 /DNA_ID=CAMNT_0013260823 /DNA_START=96 /DNA_END=578 /DNA_ORIENTATION=+